MDEFKGSDVPVAEIARQVGVSVPTIYQWKQRLGENGKLAGSAMNGSMVRVIATSWPPTDVGSLPGAHGAISLVLASGLLCQVEPDFDEQTLLRVVNLLAR
jgi:hypothetical protein